MTIRVLFLCAFLAQALAINFHRCDNLPAPTSVVVPGCTVMPCEVPNLTDFSFAVHFASPFATGSLDVDVSARLGDFNLPYFTPDHLRNGCNNINAQCPLAAGQSVVLSGTAPVEAPLTRVTVTMRFEITGDEGRPVACFAADVRLV
ncbi:uncharacterized protein LOC129740418 [Uranotaenia lowii]|uniref:uncharacterized protein LOC129740418 n=1 Tax=Uranotaenia lowii TaxID=190385 RepID=UPI0024789A2E|nr:uncharacterized protein LOC129740418 [Uranotaenia lowii]